MSQLKWRHDGRRIVVPVALLRPALGLDMRFVEGRALVDTGATNSGITPRMVEALDLTGQGKRPLNSAHGLEQTERYIFRIGFFGEPHDVALGLLAAPAVPYTFDEVSGFALEDSFELDALIGMDILSQCDFTIGRNRTCRLAFGYA